jgi:hypothetical protein
MFISLPISACHGGRGALYCADSSLYPARLQHLCAVGGVHREGAARFTRGRVMNSNPRPRNQPQRAKAVKVNPHDFVVQTAVERAKRVLGK